MRTWLITGCATGFGALTAQLALDRGDTVVATDRDVALLEHLVAERGRLVPLALDVTDAAQVRRAAAQALDAVGAVDVLVNNAGLGVGGPFEEADLEHAELVFAVNAFGPMRVTQALLPAMRARGSGHIITVSSDSGVVGFPFQSVYTATKHAVEGWAECLSHEVAPFGVCISLLEPCGSFATAMPGGAAAAALQRNRPDSPYYQRVAAIGARLQQTLPNATPPSVVAEAILALADEPDPPLRRPVGREERVALVQARQQMPDEAYVQLIRRST